MAVLLAAVVDDVVDVAVAVADVMVRVVLVVGAAHWDAHAKQSEQLHSSPAVKVWSPLKRSKAKLSIDHAGPRHWMATTEAGLEADWKAHLPTSTKAGKEPVSCTFPAKK